MKLFSNFVVILVVLAFAFTSGASAEPLGTTGKITGYIKDAKDASPLVGAIIQVQGTNLRTGSDDNGQYAILNVPVGTYEVKCTYVGYETQIQTGIKVSADLTTTADFALTLATIGTDTIEIVVKRMALNTETSGKIISSEFIENTGIRGIENIVAKTSGVVQDEKGTAINIRGGRTGETSIVIDGVVTNNPLDRGSTAIVSNNALQELAVLTGGFSAEYGNVLSGVVNVTTRSGTNKYTGSVELISDFFAGDWMETKSQGYNVYSASLGGPVLPFKKTDKFWTLFGSYERNFNLVDQPVSTDVAELWSDDGILPNYTRSSHSWTGKTNFDFGAITKGKVQINLTGGYLGNITKSRLWIGSFGKYNSFHNPREYSENHQIYGKINQLIGSKTFYDLQGSYLQSTYKLGDGIFFTDEEFKDKNGVWTFPSFLAYGDSLMVEGLPSLGITLPNTPNYGVFRAPGDVYGLVQKRKTEQYSANLNFTHQLLTKKLGSHEIKFGGEYKQFKVRYLDVNPVGYAIINTVDSIKYADSTNFRIFVPEITELNANSNFVLAYGYDPYGNEIENDYIVDGLNVTEAPKKPRVGAFYFLDKMEFKYFNTNLGLRVDYLDPNDLVPNDYRNLKGDDGVFNEQDYKKVEKTFYFSPRLGFSFPITDKTVFHAQYGKFVQLPELQLLYTNQRVLRDLADGGVGYFTVFNNPLLEPEKTTAYEIGVKHTVEDYLSLGLTAFYKETADLIQIKSIKAYDKSYSFSIYQNGDFGIIRGLDFSLDLRRFKRLRASVSYSLSFASGTGSSANFGYYIAYNSEEPPKVPTALDYDQRHTGVIELDYRFGTTDVPKGFFGGILSRLGLNLLLSFNSGRPYTPTDGNSDPLQVVSGTGGETPIAPINSSYSPWNFRLDLKLDKSVTLFEKLNFNLYIWAINVLDNELVNDVFSPSGQPGSTGWLDSFTGKQWAEANGPEAVRLYQIRSHAISNYGPPRQVRLGLRIFFN